MFFYTNCLDIKPLRTYNYFEVIKMYFPENPTIALCFDKCDEENIFINCMGYNNFNFVKPIKHFRIQRIFTLHIILEGSGTVKVKDKVYKAAKGDMFFIPPDVNLCYYPDEDNLWEYVWFEFTGCNAELYARKMGLGEENNLAKCKGFENVCQILKRLLQDHIRNISVGYYDVLSAFFKILDINIRKSENQSITDAVISYINGNYSKTDMSIPDICSHFNISHSYLCKIFKETHESSVKSYITKVRINEASRLLETTDMGIKEIAYSVGFSDSIHFMKIFKMRKGQTPTQYRKGSIYSG